MDCSRHTPIGLFGHCPEAKTHFIVSNPKHGFNRWETTTAALFAETEMHEEWWPTEFFKDLPAVTVNITAAKSATK